MIVFLGFRISVVYNCPVSQRVRRNNLAEAAGDGAPEFVVLRLQRLSKHARSTIRRGCRHP